MTEAHPLFQDAANPSAMEVLYAGGTIQFGQCVLSLDPPQFWLVESREAPLYVVATVDDSEEPSRERFEFSNPVEAVRQAWAYFRKHRPHDFDLPAGVTGSLRHRLTFPVHKQTPQPGDYRRRMNEGFRAAYGPPTGRAPTDPARQDITRHPVEPPKPMLDIPPIDFAALERKVAEHYEAFKAREVKIFIVPADEFDLKMSFPNQDRLKDMAFLHLEGDVKSNRFLNEHSTVPGIIPDIDHGTFEQAMQLIAATITQCSIVLPHVEAAVRAFAKPKEPDHAVRDPQQEDR